MFFNIIIRLLLVFCIGLCFTGCQKNKPIKNLNILNGYWQIATVEKASGKTISYSLNEMVDYITLSDSVGLRTKVKPQLDGTYITANDAEKFVVIPKNNQTVLRYTTTFDTWEETLIDLDPTSFSIKNQDGTIYNYTRFKGYLDYE